MSESIARFYAEQRFSVAWTKSQIADDAKRVVTKGWPSTPPLVDSDAAVATFAERSAEHNPVIVLRPSKLIGLDCDTPEGFEHIARLGLPATLTAQSSRTV